MHHYCVYCDDIYNHDDYNLPSIIVLYYYYYYLCDAFRHSCVISVHKKKQACIRASLQATLITMCIDPMQGQHTVTPDPQTTLTLGMHADPVIFEPLSQSWFSESAYKVTSFVNFVPYLTAFRSFVTYWTKFTNDLKFH